MSRSSRRCETWCLHNRRVGEVGQQ